MYIAPTLFVKLTGIINLIDDDAFEVGVGNSNLSNGSAIGLPNDPATNAYNNALQKKLEEYYYQKMNSLGTFKVDGNNDLTQSTIFKDPLSNVKFIK